VTLQNRGATLAQVALGALFIAAALGKIADISDFATQISHYRLAPVWSVNLFASVLPWIELLAGLSLVLRIRPRAGAVIVLVMMVVFTVAVAAAWARGLDFRCGCFGKAGADTIGMRKFAENLVLTALAGLAVSRRDD
jgi:uncharacterized membrane protein YphA (DoxX/SURF4 family)